MRHFHPSLKEFLLSLYNRIYTEEEFPTSWLNTTILPFEKIGKDSTKVENYRPIALTSCVCKLLDKILYARLSWVLEKNGIISTAQSGFRKFRSTMDPLTLLHENIQGAFKERFDSSIFLSSESL
jgi:potassium voltage-gated channel Eag-related subfamily H protein 8